jgi:hypothetical protein
MRKSHLTIIASGATLLILAACESGLSSGSTSTDPSGAGTETRPSRIGSGTQLPDAGTPGTNTFNEPMSPMAPGPNQPQSEPPPVTEPQSHP